MLAKILLMTGLVGVAATGAFEVYRQHEAGAVLQQRTVSGHLLSQALAVLASESTDIDGDGFPEPPVLLAYPQGPAGGGAVPVTSAAPKTDAWGTQLGYCPYDHGSVNASANRLTGLTSATQAAVVYAVISAGQDKVFQTSCAQAVADQVQADDGLRIITVAQLNQGVGGTQYFGDPVPTLTALQALNPAALKDGQLRVVKDTGIIYRYASASNEWVVAAAGGGSGGGGLQAPNYTGTPPTILMGNGMPVVGISVGSSGKYSFAVASDGQLYAAGTNNAPASGYSAWGDMTSTTKLSWYPVPGATGTKYVVSAGQAVTGFIVKDDNTLWAAGLNTTQGRLGTGDTANRATFTQIATGALKVEASSINGVMLKADGLYLWGDGSGIMPTANNLSPTLVPGTSSSVRAFALANGGGCLARIDADGQLWVRGPATYCSASTGNSTSAWSAVLSDVANVAVATNGTAGTNMYVVRSDGTLWVRGNSNTTYALGLNNTSNHQSFVQTSLTSVSLVAACSTAGAFAVQADGTLWATGNNGQYSHGEGGNGNKMVWTRITTISDVVGIYPSQDCQGALALKGDGTVWAAGIDYGHHGLGTNAVTRATWTRVL